jgi:hypothetical protein
LGTRVRIKGQDRDSRGENNLHEPRAAHDACIAGARIDQMQPRSPQSGHAVAAIEIHPEYRTTGRKAQMPELTTRTCPQPCSVSIVASRSSWVSARAKPGDCCKGRGWSIRGLARRINMAAVKTIET